LLLLAIYLWKANKVNWQFGWHFIWLGMAYGAKFNVLTVLPLFFLLPYVLGYRKIADGVKSIVAFFTGLIIAIPCLLLVPVKPVFLKTYLDNTFGKAEHYDDTGVSFVTWLKTGWLGAFSGGFWLGLALLIVIVWITLFGIRNYFKQNKLENSFVVILIGLGFLLPVMLLTERLWPHYLWTGHVVLLLGVGMFLQSQVKWEKLKSFLLLTITVGGFWSIVAQGSHLFSLEKQSAELIENSQKAYKYIQTQKDSFVSVQDISVFYPFAYAVKASPYHPFAEKRPSKSQKQEFRWSGFLNPQILKELNADFLITNKKDFEMGRKDSESEKEEIVKKNDSLLKEQLGKTIFSDTTLGSVKVYIIENVD
jgi:hypothetical protein